MTRPEPHQMEFVESAGIIVGVAKRQEAGQCLQWSHHTSDLKTTTILGSSNRLDSTSAISIAFRLTTTSAQDLYKKMLELYPVESTLGGRSGVLARAVKPLNPEVVP